ncbi:hypothetical protein [Natrinema longum]|uniref:Uncharacterized protein n=1 Tax=Natrinema longum TaxID=370324 RepID=A0A8A2UAP0_9EURY|nr:hypothetical protein [Natrinema longum]MBZ6496419.1 hypothetical protein [Natrinema longum]QSW85674.1 hypothetical protein J0X27_02185 [Natrinema longum]
MSTDQNYDDFLTAVALAEFSYRRQRENPRLAARSWQLAVSRLAKYDVDPYEAVDALRADDRRNAIAHLERGPPETTDPPIRR